MYLRKFPVKIEKFINKKIVQKLNEKIDQICFLFLIITKYVFLTLQFFHYFM